MTVVPLDTTPHGLARDVATAATLAPIDSVVGLHVVTTTTQPAPPSTEPGSTTTSSSSTTVAPTTTVDLYAVPPLPTALSGARVRIVVTGDSTAMATGGGLQAAQSHPDVAQVTVAGSPGGGFVRAGHSDVDEPRPGVRECADLVEERLPETPAP